MKIDLQKVRLAKSGLTDNIYVGLTTKDNSRWIEKVDVTSDFITAVIARWENQKETIFSGKQSWEISVKKLKKKL